MLVRSTALAVVGVVLSAMPASAATTTVQVKDDYFAAKIVRVNKGAIVKWVNTGDNHTVTTKLWSRALAPGQTYSRRIYRNWSYLCAYHDGMTGRVVCRNC